MRGIKSPAQANYFSGLYSERTLVSNQITGDKYIATDFGNEEFIWDGANWQLTESEAPIWLTDTTDLTGQIIVCIEAYTDCVIATMTSNITKNGTSTPLAVGDIATLPAGTRLYGVWTQIKLTSGKLICYR